TYGIHHNPKVWDDPERFDPERFTDERIAQRHKLAWVPFGAGQRQCIGRDFSIMEAQIILAMIMQHYDLAAIPGQTIAPKLSASLKPNRGVRVRLEKRGA
ncbi:MAG: cytochrome P450, partial [Roseiflexaceae bacterium]